MRLLIPDPQHCANCAIEFDLLSERGWRARIRCWNLVDDGSTIGAAMATIRAENGATLSEAFYGWVAAGAAD